MPRCMPGCGRRSRDVEVHERDEEINDVAFATAMADRLHELIEERSA